MQLSNLFPFLQAFPSAKELRFLRDDILPELLMVRLWREMMTCENEFLRFSFTDPKSKASGPKQRLTKEQKENVVDFLRAKGYVVISEHNRSTWFRDPVRKDGTYSARRYRPRKGQILIQL